MSSSVLLEDVGPGEELPGFDIDDPVLPPEIDANALRSGGYPYDERMKRKEYRKQVRSNSSSCSAGSSGRASAS